METTVSRTDEQHGISSSKGEDVSTAKKQSSAKRARLDSSESCVQCKAFSQTLTFMDFDAASENDGQDNQQGKNAAKSQAGIALDKNSTAAVLPSCTECKRRKVKCDRNVPCAACIKRGAPETCQWHWNDNQIDPVVLFTKLTEDIENLQARLAEVEQALGDQPRQTQRQQSVAPSFTSQDAQTNIASPRRVAFASFPPPSARPAARPPQARPVGSQPREVPIASTSGAREADIQYSFSSTANAQPSNEVEYDSAAEHAAVFLENFANQRSRTEDARTPITPQSHLDPLPAAPDLPWQDMELTEALTSIKDPPPRYQSQDVHLSWSALNGSSTADPLALRQAALQEVFVYLPSAAQAEYLVGLFEDKVHWRFHIVHMPAFKAEMARLWEMYARGRQLEVDPLWLAVVFMVMALALSSRPASSASGTNDPFQGLSMEQLGALAAGYHAASLKALHIGDCMGKPRLRTVQAIILFAVYFQQFLQPAAGPSSAERMLHWLAIGIRSAQMLGLHNLGQNPEIMPPDDPAWPPGKNALKRQVALRLWMNLCWADWMAATSSARSYSIHPSYCTSQMLDNLNDWEISSTDWQIQPHPPNVITSTAFEVFKWHIANLLRITYDKVVTHAPSFTYDSVLELDKEYQRMLEELPLLSDDVDEKKLPEKSFLQRHIALIGTHSRIARLHRPYLSRGYTPDSRYAYSKERCLWSAGIMVECHAKVKQVTSRGIFWFAYSHTLNAAMVLFLDLLWSIDNDMPIPQLVKKRNVLVQIQEIFSDYENIGNQSLRGMVELTYRIISGLLQECTVRQTARIATIFGPHSGQDASAKPEPFASLLGRVSSAVRKEQEATLAQRQQSSASATHPGTAQMTYGGPSIIGADNASFTYLLNPLQQSAPVFAPSDMAFSRMAGASYPAAEEATSVSASNFAGLNGLDDFFEMGNNERYNFNLWNFPTAQQQTSPQYPPDLSGDETSQMLRQLMGFEPSYSGQ